MTSLKESQITQILPMALRTVPEVKAISYAISNQIKKILSCSENAMIYAKMDSLPEKILDIMALELDTQYYDENADVEIKRNLVKNTLLWYQTAGTPKAVEELVKAVFGDGEVVEWFECGSDPYHFKIKTSKSVTGDELEYFGKMLKNIKNVRSYLEKIEIDRIITQSKMFGIAESRYIIAPEIS